MTAYDLEGITNAENELAQLQREAEMLESENQSLHKVKAANEKAIRELDPGTQVTKKFKKAKGSLNELKGELREKQEAWRVQDRLVKDEHTKIVEMEEKCRKIAQLMREQNRPSDPPTPAQNVNDNEIEVLQREIDRLEEQKNKEEQQFKAKLRKLMFTIEETEAENSIIGVKLKEKDQEVRLNELRIKELKRGVPHKSLKPLNSSRVTGYNPNNVATQYTTQMNTARQPFSARSLSKGHSHTQFKIHKIK